MTRWLIVPAVGFGAVIVFLFWLKRSRRVRFEQSCKNFTDGVHRLYDRIESLTKRHQLLPFSDIDYQAPMCGKTLQVYQGVESDLRNGRKRWVGLMDIAEEIKSFTSDPGASSSTRQKIKDRMQAAESPEAVDATLSACEVELKKLEGAHEELNAALEGLESRHRELVTKVDTLNQAGLADIPFATELGSMGDVLKKVRSESVADPLGLRSLLEEVEDQVNQAKDKVGLLYEGWERIQSAGQEVEAVEDWLKKERDEGFRLDEDGAQPDALLVRAKRELELARWALIDDDRDHIAGHLEQTRHWAAETRKLGEKHKSAGHFFKQTFPGCQDEMKRLDVLFQEGRAKRSDLTKEFAEPSWSDAASGLEEVDRVMERLTDMLQKAEEAGSREVQHFLQAEKMIREIRRLQEEVSDSVELVDVRLKTLRELKRSCRHDLRSLEADLEKTASMVQERTKVLSREVVDLFNRSRHLFLKAKEEADEPLPDWPLISERLDRFKEGLASVEEEAQEDVEAHDRFYDTFDAVRDRFREVGDFLQKRSEDRGHVNRLYEQTKSEMAEVESGEQAEDRDWSDLLALLLAVKADVEQVRKSADADIALHQEAEQAVHAAEKQWKEAQEFYEEGVSVKLDQALEQIRKASKLLAEQHYEEAVNQAGEAEFKARESLRAAQQEARRKRRVVKEKRVHTALKVLSNAAVIVGELSYWSRRMSRR